MSEINDSGQLTREQIFALIGTSRPSGTVQINSISAPLLSASNINCAGDINVHGTIYGETIDIGEVVLLPGSAVSPAVAFTNDISTGIYGNSSTNSGIMSVSAHGVPEFDFDNGVVRLYDQGSTKTGAADKLTLYSDVNSNLAVISGTGFTNKMITSTTTADRSWTFPDISGTLAIEKLTTETIFVKNSNPGYGQFTSIYAAMQTITDAGPTKPYVIWVYPGRYFEPAIVCKPFVAIVGIEENVVIVIPIVATGVFITMGLYSCVDKLNIVGQNGTGSVGVLITDTPSAYFHNSVVANFETLIKITAPNTTTSSVFNAVQLYAPFSTGILIDGSAATSAHSIAAKIVTTSMSGNNLSVSGINVTGPYADTITFGTCGISGIATGDGIIVNDGANVLMSNSQIFNCATGLHIHNTGAAPNFGSLSIAFRNCSVADVNVHHPYATGTLTGIMDRTKVFVASTSPIAFNYLDNSDNGGTVITKGLYYSPLNGSEVYEIGDQITYAATIGTYHGGNVSLFSGLDIEVSGGVGYITNGTYPDENLRKVEWVDSIVTIDDNVETYIYIDGDGIGISSMLPDLQSNILLARVKTINGSVEFIDMQTVDLNHPENNTIAVMRNAFGVLYNSGSIVTANSNREIAVTSGLYYWANNQFTPSGMDFPTTFYAYYHVAGVNARSIENIVDNMYYDNGTDLVPISGGNYVKHAIYTIGEAANEQYFLVYGQEMFATQQLAEAGPMPIAPGYFDQGIVKIAGLVVIQAGLVVSVVDYRIIIGKSGGSTTSGVTIHGDLTGLLADDHPQYMLVNGSRTITGNVNMGGYDITNAALIDGIDILQHGYRHLPSGSDPLTTAAPLVDLSSLSTNSVGTANSFARSDHSHAINVSGIDIAGFTGTLLPAHGGTGASTLTVGNFVVGNGASAVTTTKAVPSGVVLGTTDSQTLTNKTIPSGNGNIVSANSIINTSVNITAPVANQVLLASDTNNASWQLVGDASLTGQVSVAHGGTGSAALTANNFLVGNGTSAVLTTKTVPTGVVVGTTDTQTLTGKTMTATTNNIAANLIRAVTVSATPPVANQVLVSSSTTAASWQQVSDALITGQISVAHGGTGNATLTSGNFLVGSGTSAVQTTKIAPSGVVVGTTDTQTLTSKTIIGGTSSNDVAANKLLGVSLDVAAPTVNQILLATSDTTAVWSAISDSSLTGQVSVAHGGTGASTLAVGNFVVGNGTGTVTTTKTVPSGVVVGTTDTQTLTSKTIIGGTSSNDIAANKLLGVSLDVTSPTVNQVLVSTSASAASWQQVSDALITGQISVLHGGTGSSTLTSGNFLVGNGIGPVLTTLVAPSGVVVGTTDTQTLTNKTIIGGASSNDIAANKILGVSVNITAPVANQVLVSTSGSAASWQQVSDTLITGQIGVAHGGTGASTLTVGNFVVGNGTSAVTTTKAVPSGVVVGTTDIQTLTGKTIIGGTSSNDVSANKIQTISIGSSAPVTGNVLVAGGVSNASWSQIDDTSLTGQISVAHGGTGNSTLTIGNFLVGNGTSAVQTTKIVPSGDVVGTTDTQALTHKTIIGGSNSNDISANNLYSVVLDPVAPVTNQVLVATSGTSASWQNIDAASIGGVLTVAQGGTGASTLAVGNFVVGNGTSAVLTTKAVPSGVVVGTTDIQTLTRKTIIGGSSSNDIAANKLLGVSLDVAAPVANQVLVSTSASDASWQQVSDTLITGQISVAHGGTGASTLTVGNFVVGNGTSTVTTTKAVPSGVVLGTTDSQTLTNKTIPSGNGNDISANKIIAVSVSTTPPVANQVLISSDATNSAWALISNNNIISSAGIVDTKLATISTAGKVANSATTGTALNTASAIVARDASGNFTAGTITAVLNGNASTATTAVSSTNFSGSLTGDVTGTQSATVVSLVGGVSAANVASGANLSNAATNLNTVSTIVRRDASGNFTAGTISADLNGNASTATSSGSTVNFSGSLSGDVSGTQAATVVDTVGGVSATNIASGVTLANAATNLNTVSTIVARDTSGNFTAGTITAALIGNASTATSATNFSGSLTGDVTGTQTATLVVAVGGVTAANVASGSTLANAATASNTTSTIVKRDTSGNFVAGTITAALIGNVTGSASLNVLKAGDTMTGALVLPAGTAAVPALRLNGTNTGFSSTSNILTTSNNGVQTMSIDATGIVTINNLNAVGVIHTNVSGILTTSTIVNADINAAAAITDTKLATISTAGKVANSATTGTNLNTASAIVARDASGNFVAGTITAALIGNASTATSATNFSGSLTGDVTGTQAATVVSTVGGVSAANVASGSNLANASTNLNTVSTIVRRDASGNFTAGTITAALIGNASTATSATSATNFSGSLVGDVTGTQSATVVTLVGGVSSSLVASGVNIANAATNLNTVSTVVKRDASGNFTAGTITAALIGNASTATSTTSFSGSLIGDVTGTQSATVVSSVGGVTAANVASGSVLANAATALNTASTVVRRDASGNFTAGTITAALIGNASTATSATNFSGSLVGDVTGTQSATVVDTIGGITATNVASGSTLANAATNLNTASTIVKRDASGNFTAGTITAALNGNASTATSTTNFSGSLSGNVTGTQAATVVSTVGGVSAANVASGANLSNAATALNTVSTIVRRDISGNFTAGTITAALIGNASTATSAVSSTNFSGSLTGDVSGTQSVTVVDTVGGVSATNVASGATLSNAATNLNTASAIVRRDASGNFTAGTITATLIGNASSTTNFSGSLSGDVTGTQSATVVALVGGVSATNVASGATLANAATNLNTASAVVRRDASGNFTAGTITAALVGNASSATSFSGSLSGDVTGTQATTVVALVGGVSATNVASGATLANAATNLNTASAIVKRDASGNFTAGTITAALVGNASTATSTASFSGSLTGDVTGTQSATVVSNVGGVTATNVASGATLANAATNLNTVSTIVRRDASGNFVAGTISASVLSLPTTSSTVGIININSTRWAHSYGSSNVFLGSTAGNFTLTGSQNTSVGANTLSSLTNANNCTAIGYNGLSALTTGVANTCIGSGSLSSCTVGARNTANGYNTLSTTTNSDDCVAIGHNALAAATTNQLTAVGSGALALNTSGVANSAFGYSALGANILNFNCSAFGWKALALSTGNYNSAFGANSLSSCTSGKNNTAVGANTSLNLTTGDGNVSIGYNANLAMIAGIGNVAIGTNANSTANANSIVAIGNGCASSNTASGIIAIGQSALNNNTGAGNVAIGFDSMTNNINGTQNTAVGYSTLGVNNQTNCTAIGYNAMGIGANSDECTAVGVNCLSVTLTKQTAVGYLALSSCTSGSQNTAVGNNSLQTLTTGANNTALGFSTLSATNGSNNTAIGNSVLTLCSSGARNSGFGSNALATITIGDDCSAFGNNALTIATGSQSTAFGSGCLPLLTSGTACTGVGYNALAVNTASQNTAVGSGTLAANTTGTQNTAVGASALSLNTTSIGSTAVGFNALISSTGAGNTAIGAMCLDSCTTGTANTAAGFNALAAITIGSNATAFGYNTLAANTSINNTAVGSRALQSNTSGTNNTAVGVLALSSVLTAADCTAMGSNALQLCTGASNTAFGSTAGATILSGTNNICIGSAAGSGLTTGINNIYIGISANGTGDSGVCKIARIRGSTVSGGQTVLISAQGQLGSVSSTREKKDNIIAIDIEDNYRVIQSLLPRQFNYKLTPEEISFGLIVDEVEKIKPELLTHDVKGIPDSIAYHYLPIMILADHQKLTAEHNELVGRHNELADNYKKLADELAELREMVNALTKK